MQIKQCESQKVVVVVGSDGDEGSVIIMTPVLSIIGKRN